MFELEGFDVIYNWIIQNGSVRQLITLAKLLEKANENEKFLDVNIISLIFNKDVDEFMADSIKHHNRACRLSLNFLNYVYEIEHSSINESKEYGKYDESQPDPESNWTGALSSFLGGPRESVKFVDGIDDQSNIVSTIIPSGESILLPKFADQEEVTMIEDPTLYVEKTERGLEVVCQSGENQVLRIAPADKLCFFSHKSNSLPKN